MERTCMYSLAGYILCSRYPHRRGKSHVPNHSHRYSHRRSPSLPAADTARSRLPRGTRAVIDQRHARSRPAVNTRLVLITLTVLAAALLLLGIKLARTDRYA